MIVEGEYTFDAPQDLVWQALQDPDVLSSAMPGGEGFTAVGENEYEGNLNVKVGPVQGKFKGNIKLTDIVAPESYTMQVDGKGAPGFVKAVGSLKLTPDGERTHIAYHGDAQVGGRIASVGQRLLDTSAKSIIRQSLDGLNEYLKVQVAVRAAEAAGASAEEAAAIAEAEMPTYTPPSQTAVAMNVAKDVVGDLVPPPYRPLLIGGVVLLVLLILYRLFR
ncbi:MAG TPA: carbon monoxide dehydrogenase subunit G [Chloroflexota bacterium]|nr:carbon monoxide dehydrogenase subunit G [Chloroflexota bacterium]HUM72097.1 carbon monoxide dehydrogenase subunit G [Chloroflexota bacterium]